MKKSLYLAGLTVALAAYLIPVNAVPFKASVSRLMEVQLENQELNRVRTLEYHRAIKRGASVGSLAISRVRWINSRNSKCYDISQGSILPLCINEMLTKRIAFLKEQ